MSGTKRRPASKPANKKKKRKVKPAANKAARPTSAILAATKRAAAKRKSKRAAKPTGRPSKYSPEMCEAVVEIMRAGASMVEVAACLDISESTLFEWCKTDGDYYIPEFSESVKRGVRLSAAWWERAGRLNLENKDFSFTGWYMNMKNRFGWKDKIETDNKHEHTGGVLVVPPVAADVEDWERDTARKQAKLKGEM